MLFCYHRIMGSAKDPGLIAQEERWKKMKAIDLRRELRSLWGMYSRELTKVSHMQSVAVTLREFLNVEERNLYPED